MGINQRAGSAERGTLISACGLLGLSLLKGAAGWLTGSKALLADACYSATASAHSLFAYLGWRSARKSYPQTQRSEAVYVLVLSALLLVLGLEIGIAAVKSAIAFPNRSPGLGAVAAIAAGIALRELHVRYRRCQDSRFGLRPTQTGMVRKDQWVSMIALLGAVAALSGDWLHMPGLYLLDPAAGIVICALVIRSSLRLVAGIWRQAEQELCRDVDVQVIREAIKMTDGVIAVEDVRAREHGHYVVVDCTILVNPRITVSEGQEIAQRVRRHLSERFLHVADVVVQVQPFDPGYPYKTNVQEEQWPTLVQ